MVLFRCDGVETSAPAFPHAGPTRASQHQLALRLLFIAVFAKPSYAGAYVDCGDTCSISCHDTCVELGSALMQSFARRDILRSDKPFDVHPSQSFSWPLSQASSSANLSHRTNLSGYHASLEISNVSGTKLTPQTSSIAKSSNPRVAADRTVFVASVLPTIDNDVSVSSGFAVSSSHVVSVDTAVDRSDVPIGSASRLAFGLFLVAAAATVCVVLARMAKPSSLKVADCSFEAVLLAKTFKPPGTADRLFGRKSCMSEAALAIPSTSLPKLELDLLDPHAESHDASSQDAMSISGHDRPRPGDLVILGPSAPPRLSGRPAVAIREDKEHCIVAVLDERRRHAFGEWQARLNSADIALVESTAWRLGARVVVRDMLVGSRGRELNGRAGTITLHPHEGHPCFLQQEWSRQPLGNRRLAFCVRLHNPPADGDAYVIIEAQFLFSDDGLDES